MRIVQSLRDRIDIVVREMAKFGIVGAVAFVVDVSVFNLVLHQLPEKPLTAKVVSVAVATTVAYFGNRQWSFRHRQHSGFRREYSLFVVLNAVGMAIAVGCLFTSHYLLGFDSRLADNISANGVGLVLGTVFRFLAYRRWVFLAPEPALGHAIAGGPVAEGPVMDPEPADLQPDVRAS